MANAVNEPFVPSGTSGQLQVGGFVIVSGASVTNIKRTDWQGTLTLSTASRTNIILYSDDLTQWGVNGGSPTSTTTTMTDTSAASSDSMYYQLPAIPNDSSTYTIQAKVLKGTGVIRFDCEFSGGTDVRFGIFVNLATGGYTLGNMNLATVAGTGGVTDLGDSWGIWFQNVNNSSGNTACYLNLWPAYCQPANFTPGVFPSGDVAPTGTITFGKIQVAVGTAWTAFIPTTGSAVSVTDYSYTGAGVVTLGQTASGTYVWNGSGVLTAGTSGASGVLDGRTRNLVPMDGITIGPASPTATSAVTLTGKISAAGSSTQTNSATSAVTLTGSITGAGTGSQVTTAMSAVTLTGSISAAASASYLISATSAVTLTGSFGRTGISTQTNTATSSATLTTKISAAATGTYTYIGTSAATLTTYISASGSSTQTYSATSAATLTTYISASGSSTQTYSATSAATLTTYISASGSSTQTYSATSAATLTTYISASGSSTQTNSATSAATLTTSISSSGSSTQTNSGNSSVSLTTSISAAGTGAQGNVGTSAVSLTGSITAAGSSIQTNTGTSAISLAGSIAASGTTSFGGDVAVNVNGSVITFTPGKVTVPDAKTIIQTFGPLGGGGGRVIKEEKSKEKKKSKLVTSNLIRVKGSEASFNCGTVRVEIEIPPIYSKRRTVKGSEMSLTAGSVSVGIEYELQNDDEDLMQILDLLELI